MKYEVIYKELLRRGLVSGRGDFARRWLGRDPSYLCLVDRRTNGVLNQDAMWRLKLRLEQAGVNDLARLVAVEGDRRAA